jgi:hypothetical protein
MNLIKYTLLPDGTIPNYIIDGGYFPKLNNKSSPQDFDLIGLSENNEGIENFILKSDFENYIKSFNEDSYIDKALNINGKKQIYYLQDNIDSLWNSK